MINFSDIFKKGFLENGQITDLSITNIVMSLLAAFICSMIIFIVYRKFYNGVVYNNNFNVLLVMVSLVTAFIVMTISSNIVLSLGMVGALSIVRFRTAVKDPLDTGFLFFSISVGITCGAGLYIMAFLATIIISACYILVVNFRPSKRVYLLVVKFENDANEAVQKLLHPLKCSIKNKTSLPGKTELTLELKLRGDNTNFVTMLSTLEGVESAILVEYTGDFGE